MNKEDDVTDEVSNFQHFRKVCYQQIHVQKASLWILVAFSFQ